MRHVQDRQKGLAILALFYFHLRSSQIHSAMSRTTAQPLEISIVKVGGRS
jgi:hypothetical protein